MVDRDKVIEMLSRGYSHSVVAAAVGCTDGYISQLVSEDEVRSTISSKRLALLERHVDTDDSVDDLEVTALRKLHQLMPSIVDPMKALRIFQVANSAKRKTVEPTATGDSKGVTVVVNLPAVAMTQFKLSTDKQVVEVDGRSMTTLPSNILTRKLAERKEAVPQITDATSAEALLSQVASGTPILQVRNVLGQPA